MGTIWIGYKEPDESYVSISLPGVFPSCIYLIHFCANSPSGHSHLSLSHLFTVLHSMWSCRRTSSVQGSPYTSIYPHPEPTNESTTHLFLHRAHLMSIRRCVHALHPRPSLVLKLSGTQGCGRPRWERRMNSLRRCHKCLPPESLVDSFVGLTEVLLACSSWVSPL
jgi:hypothetical protein